MAFYTQSQGQAQEVIGLLRRRIWQIVLPAIVTGAIGVMAASLMPRKYEAMTQLELVDVPVPMVAAGLQPNFLKSNIWAAEYHIKSAERLRRVIESLEWEDFQTLPPDEQRQYLKRVMANLKVNPMQPQNTDATFLNLKYFDADPQRAAQFLNEVRDVYVTEKVENVRQTAVKARDKLQEQLKDSQADYDDKFNKAQELRRQHSLSPTQQAPGGGRTREEDPIYAAYIRLSEELDKVRNQRIKTEQIRASTQELYENEPKEVADTTVTPGVNLAAELVDIERSIADLRASQQGLRPATPSSRRPRRRSRAWRPSASSCRAAAPPARPRSSRSPTPRRRPCSIGSTSSTSTPPASRPPRRTSPVASRSTSSRSTAAARSTHSCRGSTTPRRWRPPSSTPPASPSRASATSSTC